VQKYDMENSPFIAPVRYRAHTVTARHGCARKKGARLLAKFDFLVCLSVCRTAVCLSSGCITGPSVCPSRSIDAATMKNVKNVASASDSTWSSPTTRIPLVPSVFPNNFTHPTTK